MSFILFKEKVLLDPRSKKLKFEPDSRNHYVYRVSNKYIIYHYYGSKTEDCKDTIGCGYYTSSNDNIFRTGFKDYPEDWEVKIIKRFDNPGDKILFESYIHQKLDVKNHNSFINRANQTPFGFDTTGSVGLVGEKNGMYGMVGELNPFYGKKHTEETKTLRRMNMAFKNNRRTKELKAHFSKIRKGKSTGIFTQKRKDNISKAALGRKWYKNPQGTLSVHVSNIVAPCYTLFGWVPGRVFDTPMKDVPKKTCPNCGRSFDPGNYTQHINKYCKHKKEK